MNKSSGSIFIWLMLFLFSAGNPLSAQPVDIDWTLLKQFQLSDKPLDVAISTDGDLFFALTPGSVAIYSDFSDVPLKQISIDGVFDRMTYSDKDRVLILSSAMTNTVKILEIDLVQKIEIEGSPFKGPENAPVTLAVFDDYQCPYCAQLESLFEQVLEKYPEDVKLVVKHFPLKSHKMALKAALAALAANNQGKFWEFHSRLFENFNALSDPKIEEIAKDLNLDMKTFLNDQKTAAVRNVIYRDIQNGQSVGVKGTPSLYVNGKHVKNRTLQAISRMIENELGKKTSE